MEEEKITQGHQENPKDRLDWIWHWVVFSVLRILVVALSNC